MSDLAAVRAEMDELTRQMNAFDEADFQAGLATGRYDLADVLRWAELIYRRGDLASVLLEHGEPA